MARQARKKSSTGVYHIMLRGIDKRDLFLDDEDRKKFKDIFVKAIDEGRFDLYGYCLMGNHVHLLLKAMEDPGIIMKRITVSYVWWHNDKHERTGHLFQNRYLSEPVEEEDYLLTVLRYIHQNPFKAGMVKSIKDYHWSSYDQYKQFYKDQKTFISGDLIKFYFPTFSGFDRFMTAINEDKCLEVTVSDRTSDKKLIEKIKEGYDLEGLRSASADKKRATIKEIYDKTGASIRQLSRVTGIGRNVIERAIK